MLTSCVSSTANSDAGERRAHRAAQHRGHADQRPEPGAAVGQHPCLDAAERAADHQQRRQHAARRARAERHRPDQRLHDQDAEDRVRAGDVAGEQRADRVVADAERLRERAGRRCRSPTPPIAGHHIQWIGRRAEAVLGRVDGAVSSARQQRRRARRRRRSRPVPAGRRRPDAASPGTAARGRAAAARQAAATSRLPAPPARGCAASIRTAAARPRAAPRRPACRTIADMPAAAPATSSVLRSALVRWKQLREQRAERAAGHDDRPFGAERSADADRDRRRQRLEHRDLRLDAAAADQDRLDGLGDAVAADPARSRSAPSGR